MAFKRLLILLRSYPSPTPTAAVTAAVDIALSLDAKISALSCAILPHVPKSILSGVVADVSALVHETRCKSLAEAQQLLRGFTALASARNVLGQGIYKECLPYAVPALLAGYARLNDMTIVPMPEGSYLDQLDSHWYLETALFQSGRPVLVLPHDQSLGAGTFGTVVVAWDNSRAAARAVADALPVLQRARSVRLVTIMNEKVLPTDPPLSEMVSYLAAHGIRATHDIADAGGLDAGAAIASYLRKHGGNLLVMGGYGHTRLREFVLGGATKQMLTHPPVPVLMAH